MWAFAWCNVIFLRTQIYIIIESIVEGSGKRFLGNLVVAALPQKETDPKITYSRPKTKHGHKVKILNSERGRHRRWFRREHWVSAAKAATKPHQNHPGSSCMHADRIVRVPCNWLTRISTSRLLKLNWRFAMSFTGSARDLGWKFRGGLKLRVYHHLQPPASPPQTKHDKNSWRGSRGTPWDQWR